MKYSQHLKSSDLPACFELAVHIDWIELRDSASSMDESDISGLLVENLRLLLQTDLCDTEALGKILRQLRVKDFTLRRSSGQETGLLMNNINIHQYYITRRILLEELVNTIDVEQFIFFDAPSGTGKTSLVELLKHKQSSFEYIEIKYSSDRDISELLKTKGIDLQNKTLSGRFQTGTTYVIILDNAHRFKAHVISP
jgi:hypothetical protein